MKAEYIEKMIDNGKTLVFSTCMKSVTVDKKCLDQWRRAGVPLFKDGDDTGFYIGRGKNYDFILESVCNVRFV